MNCATWSGLVSSGVIGIVHHQSKLNIIVLVTCWFVRFANTSWVDLDCCPCSMPVFVLAWRCC
jgi:hypothetical protein